MGHVYVVMRSFYSVLRLSGRWRIKRAIRIGLLRSTLDPDELARQGTLQF